MVAIRMQKQTGFTLIELMVSMGIGLFLIAGVFSVYLNSSQSQKVVEDEVKLTDDARFALETISFDLRQAGVYGTLNHESYDKVDAASKNLTQITSTSQCDTATPGWITRVERPVFASDNANPYGADCIPSSTYKVNTDVLEVRYVNRIEDAENNNLIADAIYMNSDSNNAQFFIGSAPPAITTPQSRNYRVVTKAYYISDYTDSVGDGIPSLHVVSLQPGPSVTDTLLLSGVENLQLQFGLTATNKGTSVVTWVDPTAAMPWDRVIAARVWLVMKSKSRVKDTPASGSFEIPGSTLNTLENVSILDTDGYRRVMVTTAVRLRNMNTGGR